MPGRRPIQFYFSRSRPAHFPPSRRAQQSRAVLCVFYCSVGGWLWPCGLAGLQLRCVVLGVAAPLWLAVVERAFHVRVFEPPALVVDASHATCLPSRALFDSQPVGVRLP